MWPVYLIYKLSVFPSHELLKYEVFSHLLLASFCQCGKKPNSDKIMPEQKRYNEEYFLPGYLMECPHPCMAVPSSCLLSLNMSKNNQRDDREDQQHLCPQICSSLRVWTFFFFCSGKFYSCYCLWQLFTYLVVKQNYLHLFLLPIYSSFNKNLSVART